MIAWISGLVLFATWGALLAWKYAPYHVSHVTIVTQSAMAHLVSFVFAFVLVFFSHMLIHWLMITIFDSSVLESQPFYFVSLFLTAGVFGIVFLSLILWHVRRLASHEGQERLKRAISEAARELGIDDDKQNE